MPFYTWLDSDRIQAAERRRIIEGLERLRALRDASFSCNTARSTIRIATWNLRSFGGGKIPKHTDRYCGNDPGLRRMRESLAYIVEVIAMFDLVALQEVKSLEGDFAWVMRRLGPDWDYLATEGALREHRRRADARLEGPH